MLVTAVYHLCSLVLLLFESVVKQKLFAMTNINPVDARLIHVEQKSTWNVVFEKGKNRKKKEERNKWRVGY